ncbi:MAG: TrkH family potassium uptake protein [Clostridia bacterium]|nr:TrkH family potassium uptake protein [Clostridia bacterium]
MNIRIVLNWVGRIILLEAALLLMPLTIALIYRETCAAAFLWTILIAAAAGGALFFLARPKVHRMFAREGFAIVSLAWLLMALIGALPFLFSRQIPAFEDAFFETVSGFTTTGASIVRDLTVLDRGILFWRSFTHWIGGMGILVFMMAFLPSRSDRPIHIARAEIPGPVMGKIMPRMRDTAQVLYLIYIGMTILEFILLLCGGMRPFDSIIHAFGTAGTGGFGVRPDSLASYSPFCQWVITVFMLLFGVNFNLYFFLLVKRMGSALRSSELWLYLGVFASATVVVVLNVRHLFGTLEETVRHSAFQVSSILTTTGFATVDFDAWPALSKTVLLLLMFLGGCAGSTAGGIKMSRVLILFHTIRNEVRHLLHPRSVTVSRIDGKKVEKDAERGTLSYFAIYMLIFAVCFLLVSANGFDMETNISAVAACFNNIGPGFGRVGPAANYADFSAFSKIVLSLAMLFGRLEIWPLLLGLAPSNWRK